MTITTTSVLPAEVRQYFDRALLCKRIPDNAQLLNEMYVYIRDYIKPKCGYNARRMAKFEELEKEYLNLYGRTKAKEEKREAEEGNKTQGPFYRIRFADKSDEEVFLRLRRKRNILSKKTSL